MKNPHKTTANTSFQNNIGIGDEPDDDWSSLDDPGTGNPPPTKQRDWLDLISDANSYLSVHLLFTYLITLIALRFIYQNYRRFIRARQLFSLELVHSIAARTVLVSGLPPHLRGERALAEHFENMNLSVESVSVTREVGSLKSYLDKRTKALKKLESAWVDYVGNPSTVESYDPSDQALSGEADPGVVESQSQSNNVVVPHKKRPTLRPGWFSKKVDAIEYLESEFQKADELVRRRRRTAKLKATDSAFVTFENMSSAVRPPSSTLVLRSRSEYLIIANCCPNSPRFDPLPVNDQTRPRTARHSLVEYDALYQLHSRSRTPRSYLDCLALLLLDYPHYRSRWVVEL